MTDIITEIMVEVLKIFRIATKELRRGSASEFRIGYLWILTEGGVERMLRKLAGMADLEGALKKLDRLTQEEARMALSEVLRLTHSVRDEVKVVDNKVERVGDKVADMGDEVADVGDKVEDVGDRVADLGDQVEDIGHKVQCVDEKVQVVIDGAGGVSSQLLIPSNVYAFRRQGSKTRDEASKIDDSAGG